MGNHIENGLTWSSQQAYFEICNNYIEIVASTGYVRPLYNNSLQATPGGTNLIANNTIIAVASISTNSTNYLPHGIYFSISSGQNLVIANNNITAPTTTPFKPSSNPIIKCFNLIPLIKAMAIAITNAKPNPHLT